MTYQYLNAKVNLLYLLQNKIMLLFGFKVCQFNVFRFKSLRFKSESASLQKWVINVLLRLEYENFVLFFTSLTIDSAHKTRICQLIYGKVIMCVNCHQPHSWELQ